jgi:capsular exopolysaccharide synthesis family protein
MAKWTTVVLALALLVFLLWYNADARNRSTAPIRPRIVTDSSTHRDGPATVSLVGRGKVTSHKFDRGPSLIRALIALGGDAAVNSSDVLSVSRARGPKRQILLRLPLDTLWSGVFGGVELQDQDVIIVEALPAPAYRWGFSAIELLVAAWAVLLSIDKGVSALFGGWAKVGERLNLRTTRPKDVRDLNLSFLVTVPTFSKEDLARPTPGDSPKLVTLRSNNPGSEPFRRLRQLLTRISPEPRTVMITSPQQGDGKSTIAANLARAFAYDGKSVLLVDADCWKPTVHTTFGAAQSPGLYDVLRGNRALHEVIHTSQEKPVSLTFVPAGEAPENAVELLEGDSFKSWLAGAAERWEIVVLDAPPVLQIAAAEAMIPTIGMSLLVVSSRGSDRHSVKRAAEMLRVAAGENKPSGVVLNRFSSVAGSYFDWFASRRQTTYGPFGLPVPKSIARYRPSPRQFDDGPA